MDSPENRMKLLRKTLGLSMEKFGEKIGLTKASISKIESGVTPLTQKNIKLICSVYSVDYFWLTEGEGEMFLEFPDTAIDMIIEDYNLDETDRAFLETYITASSDERKYLKTFFTNVCKKY